INITHTDVKIALHHLTPGASYLVGVRYSTQALMGRAWPFPSNTTVYNTLDATILPGQPVPNSTVSLPITDPGFARLKK
ncbi:MAG: hypothetical protein KGM43_17820, partial [Planctomycetota bacterium]|nr:hypothetical protein [Planctomycetota bacterium]